MFIIFFILNAIVIGGFCAYIASQKNRDGSTWFFLGALFSFVALFALIAVPKIEKLDGQEKSKFSTTLSIENFQGIPDLSSGKYQLFLTEKFNIIKNATLEKYVVDETLFLTLDEALSYAHKLYQQQILLAERKELQYAYLIKEVTESGNAKASGVKEADFLIVYNNQSITSEQGLANAIATLTEPKTLMLVIREGLILPIPIDSGRLGIDGEMVKLDDAFFLKRLNNLSREKIQDIS